MITDLLSICSDEDIAETVQALQFRDRLSRVDVEHVTITLHSTLAADEKTASFRHAVHHLGSFYFANNTTVFGVEKKNILFRATRYEILVTA